MIFLDNKAKQLLWFELKTSRPLTAKRKGKQQCKLNVKPHMMQDSDSGASLIETKFLLQCTWRTTTWFKHMATKFHVINIIPQIIKVTSMKVWMVTHLLTNILEIEQSLHSSVKEKKTRSKWTMQIIIIIDHLSHQMRGGCLRYPEAFSKEAHNYTSMNQLPILTGNNMR